MDQISLTHEASAGDTHKQTLTELPSDVVHCLENARFLNLATCVGNQPHVSLMNYTYLPASKHPSGPVIIMTTNPSSKKFNNLQANPNVSVLVHDWVSHRPATRRLSSGNRPERLSNLASFLVSLNTNAVSNISVSINGTAEIVKERSSGGKTEEFYRQIHVENNTFDAEGADQHDSGVEDGGRDCFVANEDVQVILVHIRDGRTSDWKGSVKDWVLSPQSARETNGVR
ncbi:pyridoxamine 5'-phosphate oxidase [Xylariaceae sp. FL0255]|nr:pyridoxamine 5'-phosphate oxidase [Xylariaceae sp. FL0255]